MTKLARGLAVCLAAAALGACAPSFRFAAAPGCGAVQNASQHRTRIMMTTQQVQRMQAKYNLSARYVAANPEHWRAAATGECRY
jgi:hypothetical protein